MNPIFKSLIKQFLPDIREKAAPVIDELLMKLLESYQCMLEDDEDRADIVIECSRNHIVVYVCAMTRDNRIGHMLKKYELPELVELLLSNLDKINEK